jgi:hypothetical protein
MKSNKKQNTTSRLEADKKQLIDLLADLSAELMMQNEAIKTTQKGFDSRAEQMREAEDIVPSYEVGDFSKFIAIRLGVNRVGVESLAEYESKYKPTELQKLEFELSILNDIKSILIDLKELGRAERSIKADIQNKTPFTWIIELISKEADAEALLN